MTYSRISAGISLLLSFVPVYGLINFPSINIVWFCFPCYMYNVLKHSITRLACLKLRFLRDSTLTTHSTHTCRVRHATCLPITLPYRTLTHACCCHGLLRPRYTTFAPHLLPRTLSAALPGYMPTPAALPASTPAHAACLLTHAMPLPHCTRFAALLPAHTLPRARSGLALRLRCTCCAPLRARVTAPAAHHRYARLLLRCLAHTPPLRTLPPPRCRYMRPTPRTLPATPLPSHRACIWVITAGLTPLRERISEPPVYSCTARFGLTRSLSYRGLIPPSVPFIAWFATRQGYRNTVTLPTYIYGLPA